jgi:hypothetical protein
MTGNLVMMIKTKKQILYIFLGFLVVLSFYLILEKIINKPTVIQPPEKEEVPSEERDFVFFQTSIGKIVEEIALNENANEKLENIIKRVERVRNKSEELKNLSRELKELTNNCLCGKSACQEVNCEEGCCCQATGCSTMNTCSKSRGCPIEISDCDLSIACPERDCDLESIDKKISEIEESMVELKIQQKEILIAQLSLLSDYIKLKKVKMMVNLPSEAIDYESFFKKKDLIENIYKQKLAITTFSTWPEPTIKVEQGAAMDPTSIYFDKGDSENEQVIRESSRLEPFLIIANQCPEDLNIIMRENTKEVLSGLKFKDLVPPADKMNNIIQESVEEATPQITDEISKAIANILGQEIATVVIEELKGETGTRINIPINSVEQIEIILINELPNELSDLFFTEIKEEILAILSDINLLPFEIGNSLSGNLADLLPDDLRNTLSFSVGEVLPGDLMDLVYITFLDKLFYIQSDGFIPEQALNTINPTLTNFLPDKMSPALSLKLTDILDVSLRGFLTENIPQTLGFVSSDEKRLSNKIEKKIEEELFVVLNKKLQGKLPSEQINQFSIILLEEVLPEKIDEALSENFFLVLKDRTEKIIEIISNRASKKLAENMGGKITDLTSKELAERVAEDLKEIVIPIMSKIIAEGLHLNSLHSLKSLDELKNFE